MTRLIVILAFLLSGFSVSAQSDSTAIIMMSVYESNGLGNNNRMTISYPGSERTDEFVLLDRIRLLGNQHKNQRTIAEAINKIVLMGYELDEFQLISGTDPLSRYSTYVFVRKEQ